ncbi:MAG TPA: hypothetical protein PK894_05660 [Defluviitoga sp.]|nr:hypothetical protein [Defluviitoga sp.]HOP25082.1 hypothetical protein [Defluviitoga sp.]HPZ29131.1 hypothetical protein [Defluviitoga sp.]HQD63061.1 hypothetical protein [Defluviitoga sp.]
MALTKVGLIYNGPATFFGDIFYIVYKYADVSIPPDPNYPILKIGYEEGFFNIEYLGQIASTSFDNIERVIQNLLNEYQKSIFVIADNSLIITSEGTQTNAFLPWDKKITVDLLVDDIIYAHEFTPPLGEFIVTVPTRWIDLEITGSKSAKINGVDVELPVKITVPPSKIVIEYGFEKVELDLTNFNERLYTVYLQKQDLYKSVGTKIKKVFELESGIYFYGTPLSIWVPIKDEPVIIKSRFYCDYGDMEEKSKTYYIDGEIVFAYEKDKTVYLISSSGHFFTLGNKTLNKDLGRAPLSIVLTSNYIQVTTFGLNSYKIDFTGGIYKEGNVYNMFLDLPDYSPKEIYKTKNYVVEVKDNIISIYNNKD